MKGKMFAILVGLVVFGATEVLAGSFYLSLLKKRQEEGYRVKYQIKVSSPTGGQQVLYQTVYRKGNNYRMDMEEGGRTSRVYKINDKSYSCSKTEKGWQCFEGGLAGMLSGGFQEFPESEKAATATSTRTVAGQKVRCYKPKVQSSGEKIEFCVNKKGLPLFISREGADGSFTMEAVDYSLNVSDADFKVPAKTFSMKNMMKGLGGMGLPIPSMK
ncbi:hypothetical protein [Thermodesulfatator autotrophicus]|uniref:DUF4412 domain-containing protein n=1 Tax=Thermodesulfatator autotrophicus TaxID=1795632 RepID=A0A177E5L1_9BACT|nr:hypothetical protein [Thermodesulfatator autotrophicus]OAG27253.1 hypothetical protein TH606_07840 [Thermodesulfatator autotrophicus]